MISDLKNLISEKKNEIIIGVLIAIIIALWSKIVGLLSYLYWLSFFKRCRIAMQFCDDAIIPYEDRVLLSGTAAALCLSIIIVLLKTAVCQGSCQ